MVKKPQTTTMYPWSFNHPRVIGITIAGTEIKNVRNTRTAFPIAAISPLVCAASPLNPRKPTVQRTLCQHQIPRNVGECGRLGDLVLRRQGEDEEKTTSDDEQDVDHDKRQEYTIVRHFGRRQL